MELRVLAFFLLIVNYNGCIGFSQLQVQSAAECLDWYLVNSQMLSQRGCCYAQAEIVETIPNSSGILNIEWFTAESVLEDRSAVTYSETRYVFSDGPLDENWEKILKRGQEFYLARGTLPSPLMKVAPPEYKDGKFVGGNHAAYEFPNVLTASLYANTMFATRRDSLDNMRVYIDSLVLLDDQNTSNGFLGVWTYNGYDLEITFDKKIAGLPTLVRGYFAEGERTSGSSNLSVLERTRKQRQAFEIKTKWMELKTGGETFYVPLEILNHVMRISKNSNFGREMEIRATWSLDVIDSKNFDINHLNNDIRFGDGVIAKQRSKLLKQSRMAQ